MKVIDQFKKRHNSKTGVLKIITSANRLDYIIFIYFIIIVFYCLIKKKIKKNIDQTLIDHPPRYESIYTII